ncbi:MAG: glycerol-3-phosphate dehydrogenase/oxidase [Calditrichaeota bacterium]|nr:glycerol-3-phosphate dehydrogenase/oxidase [Calditrichota bacterium]
MQRNLKKMSDEKYDLVVIGAGIYGAATAWDATLRGLKVALIDKGDFGGATSANSLKIIHGGLRYLQQFDVKRMRESIRERKILMYIAPNFVHPLPILMPTYSWKLKSRPALALALLANDIVGFDRNGLADPHKYMPLSKTMSPKKLKELIPGYDKYNLNGGALWYDCQCYNTERLLLHYVISAANKGAVVANYVKASGFVLENDRIAGVKVHDMISGDDFVIRTNMVINDAGPWVDKILADLNGRTPRKKFNLSTAMNIVVNRDIMGQYAAGLSGPYRHVFEDGREYRAHRILFFAPWRGKTIIGTNHRPYYGDQDKFKITEEEIASFLADVNEAYPTAKIKREEVTYFYGGFLPMDGTNPKTGEVQLMRHYKIFDHYKEDKIQGLITAIGVKYTTARDVAKKTVDFVFKKMGKKSPLSHTDRIRLYGGEIDMFEDFVNERSEQLAEKLDRRVVAHLSHNYGSAMDEILEYEREGEENLRKLDGSDEVLRAEVIHAVRKEMAQKLADVILRRTDLGSAGHPGEEAVAEAAEIMAKELGWSKEKKETEIQEVEQIYIPA